MPPHAGFSHHYVSERTPSPTDNTTLGTAPEAVTGPVAATYQMLNPSPSVPSDWLPLELTLPEYLRNLTGVEDLSQLRHLKLRVITGEASIQRISIYTPSLVHLDLQGSCLGSLRDLGCGLVALEILSVSRCGLNSLDGTFGFPSLKEFTASHNRIKDVAPCSAIENLRFLDVQGNPISDINSVGLLFLCSELEELVLLGCPVTEIHNYRGRVRGNLPMLKILDKVSFSDDLSSSGEVSSSVKKASTARDNVSIERESESCPEDCKDEGSDGKRDAKEEGEVHGGGTRAGEDEKTERGLQRPASAAARVHKWGPTLPAISSGGVKRRPHTARARTNRPGDAEPSFPIRLLVCDESPSSLTSGDAVSGNIASALLSSRSRSTVDAPLMKTAEDISEVAETQEKGCEGGRDDILVACQKWREAYALFRQKNRGKWEKEAEESEEGTVPRRK